MYKKKKGKELKISEKRCVLKLQQVMFDKMKKFLIVFVALFLFMPVAVKADKITIGNVYYNKDITLGGYMEVIVPINSSYYDTIGEISFKYDSGVLSIKKEDVRVYACGVDILDVNFSDKEGLEISVSDGLVTVKSDKKVGITGCVGDYSLIDIRLKFKTLKEGEAAVNILSDYYMSGGGPVDTVIKANVTKLNATEETYDCNCDNDYDDKDKTNISTTGGENDNEVKTVGAEKNKDNNNDILLYCSLGVNILLLIILIAVVSKKNKVVVKESNV